MTCLPGPTFIQGLWGVIRSKRATMSSREISIKKTQTKGSWGRTERWSCAEFQLQFFSLYLYLYTRQLFLLLWLIQLPWKSLFPYFLTSTCVIHVGVFLSFFYVPNLFYFQDLPTPTRNLVWLSLCVGLLSHRMYPHPAFPFNVT